MTTRAKGFGATEALSQEQAIWLVSSFAAVHKQAFDAALFAQQCPAPIARESFNSAIGEVGLEYSWSTDSLESVLALRLPVAIVVDRGTEGSSGQEGDSADWALVLNADEEKLWMVRRGADRPESVSIAEAQKLYRRQSLALWPKPAESVDPDGIESKSSRFGLRWFVPELAKYKSVWRDVLIASVVLQVIGLATPLFTQVIIDKVVVHRTQSTLIALGTGLAVFLVFTTLLTWVRQYLILHTGQRIDAVLGSRVFDQLFRLPPLYFQNRPTGVIAARMQGIETIRDFIASAAVTVALDLPFLLIFVAIMFWYSVPLTLLVLGVLGLISLLSALVAPLFRERLNEQFRRGATNQAFLTEYVAGMETVKSLQFEPQLNQRYRNLLAEYLKASFVTRQLGNTYNTWANMLEQFMTLAILVLGAWTVMNQTAFTVGMLVAFQMFANRLSQPVLRLVGLWQQWQQTRMSIARLGDIMNAPTEHYSSVPRRVRATGAGELSIEGLAFRYNEQLPLLYENLQLNVPAGLLVALMGPSGAGKSTLAKLLQGFYAPTRGRIRIDGIDIGSLSANELRSTFGVVPQETVLFSGTILDNLKMANPFASFEQVVAACKMAEVHSVIEALPQGYQTEIGERGAGLSGGQRQRMSIARALLKGPRILIFDEATSSVDPITAEHIGRTINALKGRTTILFIAHQLPKVLQVDQIFRIGDKIAPVESREPPREVRDSP